MTTMSVVDVESIVGDMPAQACEMPDNQMNPICSSEAAWLARVHINQTMCTVRVLAFCEYHMTLVETIITNDPIPQCFKCGDTSDKFRKERL